MHFGMKLYNDQSNTQVFNLFIYLLLPYISLVSWVWCQLPGADNCRICTPASEDGLKESPKHVRQKLIDK
jgi:hypothetical protein